jgi:ABC-type multidrug transport system fused ATPase/permease subunit
VFFLTATSIANAFVPILLAQAITILETTSDVSSLLLVLSLTLILNLGGWVFNYFRQIHSSRVIGAVVLDLRREVDQSVLNHDLSFFDKYPTGKIVSRINTDSRDFGQAASLFMQTTSSLLVIFIVIAAMSRINLFMTGIFMLMIPFVFLIALAFRKIARRRTLMGQRALAVVNAFVQESISGIQIAKTFRQETKLYERFNEVNTQSYQVNLKRAFVMSTIFPVLSILQGIVLAALIYFGGVTAVQGTMTTGDLFLFIQSLQLSFFPLLSIASFWPQFQAGLSSAERIFALIDTPPVVTQNNDVKPEEIKGRIDFEKLQFAYKEGQNVFDNFSLIIQAGESIAIVGATGAGKSSLARLLARFYEFQEGNIIIDETNIRDFNLSSYRKHIGIISQSPFLWADTLENNVKYGKPSATYKEVCWALEQAGGSEWVNDLPNGLQTNIRERGSLLSLGQRQLVAFARVLLENPSILVLDEATASVDPFTEARIQDALERTIQNRTSIIIAHRLSTVRRVDRIIVLDHGTIVEEGSHDELMEKGGYYASLYTKYFKFQSLDYIEQADYRTGSLPAGD